MIDDELMTIGAFARSCGLTASALRFYADSGLLAPALVDASSGYRYYAPDQVARATLIRQLRELDLSLPQIAEVLSSDAGERAEALIDEHVDAVAARLGAVAALAAAAKRSLRGEPPPGRPPGTGTSVVGAVFAAAVEQVLTATAWDAGIPVLSGVHIAAGGGQLVLTATDRYRLATRTLVPRGDAPEPWEVTVHGDDLRAAAPWLRARTLVRLRPAGDHLRVEDRRLRTLPPPYPDVARLLAGLPAPVTRVVVARHVLLAALEDVPEPDVVLRIGPETVTVADVAVTAAVTGPGLTAGFAFSTLYPALSSAVGPDVMLELTRPDLPVVVRSADTGDLTALVMPVLIPGAPE